MLSWNGFNLHGDVKSIEELKSLLHKADRLAYFEAEYKQRKPSPEHERYAWLRDGKSRYGGYCGSAPFVMNPRKSKLYAIATLQAVELDVSIDHDIFFNKVEELELRNEVVERGLVPPEGRYHPEYDRISSDAYCQVLYKLAQADLGWSDERVKLAMEYE